MKKSSTIIILHILLAVYSLTGAFSKLASAEVFLSKKFCLFYFCVIVLLGVYAVGWQQIIKRMPLTTAYANKAVTVIWGSIWGIILFNETISFWKIIGISLIIFGIVLFATDSEEENER